MQTSKLELENYYIESLSWSLVEGYESGAPAVLDSSLIECAVRRADIEPPRHAAYQLKLSLNAGDAALPYEWAISLVGYFRLHDSVPDDQVEALMDTNAPAVLYGAAREALATALSRGPFRAPLLPSVNFVNLARAEQAAESVTAKPLKPPKTKALAGSTAKTAAKPRGTRAKKIK